MKLLHLYLIREQEKGTNNILYEIENKCIWNKRVACQSFQEKYKFQYFGELLERYEEK